MKRLLLPLVFLWWLFIGFLLLIDCLLNVVLGGSFRNTLSAEAWTQRDHRYWGWTHKAIDAMFFWQAQHCKAQHERETAHGGSIWRAWKSVFTTTP